MAIKYETEREMQQAVEINRLRVELVTCHEQLTTILTSITIEPCGGCGGDKIIVTGKNVLGQPITKLCPTCGGTGKVVVTPATPELLVALQPKPKEGNGGIPSHK